MTKRDFFKVSDASSLIPRRTPTQLSENTVTVGPQVESSILSILRSFEVSLAQSSEDAALVVTTSGSTGMPKQTVLSSRSLIASGHATAELLGTSNAQWMLALPVHYIAGAQVLARSVLAGTEPVLTSSVAAGEHFSAASFLNAFEQMKAHSLMTSFVPAQLHTLLEAAASNPDILPALKRFDGILLGGAPSSASLLQTAQDAGLRVFTTYGSAETSGGCVYNGQPLPGVQIFLEEQDDEASESVSRIWLGGAMVASGYLADEPRTQEHFFVDENGTSWYRTDDVGSVSEGKLLVEGRSDDVIITGGVKVSPAPIVSTLEKHPAVREAFVTGIPDAKWGSAVVAAVNVRNRTGSLAFELDEMTKGLDVAQRPKHIEILDNFPLLSTGKPDRKRLSQFLQEAVRNR